jgi:nucleoside-diphosphate-sugar epimerase
MGLLFNRTYAVDFVALRLGNVYGAGRSQGTTALLSTMIANVMSGKETTIPFGDQMFVWVYVEDVAAAIHQALNCSRNANRIMNIAGRAFSLKQAADMVRSHRPEAEIRIQDGTAGESDRVQVSPWNFDMTAAQRWLNWTPGSDTEGIRATVNMLKELV